MNGLNATLNPSTNDRRDAIDATPAIEQRVADGRAADDVVCPTVRRVLLLIADPTGVCAEDALATFLAHRPCFDELQVIVDAKRADVARDMVRNWLKDSSTFAKVCRNAGIDHRHLLLGRQALRFVDIEVSSGAAWALLNTMLDVVRSVCAERTELAIVVLPDVSLLGIAAHSALQLAGRARDRFYYVVSSPDGDVTPSRRKRRAPSRHATRLVELPPVLAERTLDGNYQQLAFERQRARRRLAEPSALVIDRKRRRITVDGTIVRLPRLAFFWICATAMYAPNPLPVRALYGNFDVDRNGRTVVPASTVERGRTEEIVRQLHGLFTSLFPNSADEFPLILKRACGPSPGLPSTVARINAALRGALGIAAGHYMIASERGGEGYRFGSSVRFRQT